MPIIQTVKGDLLKKFKDGEFDAIAHGCNCFHMMGAGIARQIAREFPAALEADRKQTILGDPLKLGYYSRVLTAPGWILNAYTQYRPGWESPDVLYKSISSAFERINRDVSPGIELCGVGELRLGIPKIGAGLAGGDWNIIESVINRVSPRLSITLVEYDPKL